MSVIYCCNFIIRHFIIIAIILIASFSYYGIVNEKGEKVNNIEEVVNQKNVVENNVVEENKSNTVSEENTSKIAENIEIAQEQVKVENKDNEESKKKLQPHLVMQ